MRIIVYPHELAIGGSQINAIDLGATLRELGHEVVVYGVPGPLVSYIGERGLRFVPAHRLKYRPAPTRIQQLLQLARREKTDIIHAYEWPPALDAFFGAHLLGGVPILCTVLSMAVSPLVPTRMPLVMGTNELQAEAQRTHRGPVAVMEPPIDVDRDHPGIDGSAFRAQVGVEDDELLVVTVSRLSIDLKIDALMRAIDATALLARRYPVRLAIVGGGEAAGALEERARSANSELGRDVITLMGPTLDPRPAYAAADIVVGMGSSILRAMAFAKPVIVQGEHGFSLVLDRSTVQVFEWQGFYGIGDDRPGAQPLADQLESLLSEPGQRTALGDLGREIVVGSFSLRAAATELLGLYREAIDARTPRLQTLADAARAGGRAAALEIELHRPSNKRVRKQAFLKKISDAAGDSR